MSADRERPAKALGAEVETLAEIRFASGAVAGYDAAMTLLAETSSVLSKTKELCEQIVEDPNFRKLQGDVERFLSDDAARLQYQSVHERGEELHHKQQAGIELGAAEIREFESLRDSLLGNPVAKDFMAAQRELETLQQEIGRYIGMTLELGRVPTPEDLHDAGGGGCCGGGGCGC